MNISYRFSIYKNILRILKCNQDYWYTGIYRIQKYSTEVDFDDDYNSDWNSIQNCWIQSHQDVCNDILYCLKIPTKFKGDKEVVDSLCKAYEISHHDALSILRFPRLVTCKTSSLLANIEYLKSKNITAKHLNEGPWLLWQKPSALELKFEASKQEYLFNSNFDSLGFTLFAVRMINSYNEYFKAERHDYPNNKNKIYYIADELKLPMDLLTLKLVKHYKIIRIATKQNLQENINTLKDYNIPVQYILDDLHVLKVPSSTLKKRLEEFASVSHDPPRLWALRCHDELFKKHVINVKYEDFSNKFTQAQIMQQIMNELHCDTESVNRMVQYYLTTNKYSTKTSKKVKILRQYGYSNEKIGMHLHLLRLSNYRLKSRLETLKELQMDDYPPSILTYTDAQFDKFCQRVERTSDSKS